MIRDLKHEDLKAIQAIYNEAILNTTVVFDISPKSDDVMQKWYEMHTGYHKVFIFDEGGEAVGFASLSPYRAHQAYAATVELSIYVEKSRRGSSIGKQLMQTVLDYAKGCSEIHTIVSVISSTNTKSIQFHIDSGFEHCGTIRDAGYKFGEYIGIDNLQIIV